VILAVNFYALGSVLVGLLTIGTAVACLLCLLRVGLPRLAVATDRAASRGGGWRMILLGLLPVVGAGLLQGALDQSGNTTVQQVFAIVVLLPMVLLVLIGAMGGVVSLGRRLLAEHRQVGDLAAALTGAGCLAAAHLIYVVEALGVLYSVVLLGWLLHLGIGTFVGPGRNPGVPTPGDSAPDA